MKKVILPLNEFAKPIYETWDAEGYPPPEGYQSWLDYLKRLTPPSGVEQSGTKTSQ